MRRGDKTPLVRGGGRRRGRLRARCGPHNSCCFWLPLGRAGGVDLGVLFLYEKRWKIVRWQMPGVGSRFLPETPSSGLNLRAPPSFSPKPPLEASPGRGKGKKIPFSRKLP